ncbi:uncharacterized protein LOC133904580 [Phragmites australis]|uniref:uncharacterized protein LOC133904580 n=1 Tax=Phragmites australis TaxID=29695 RepID=UPI002D76748F|nr:uncharacterized protein LOC133904580 [Phragmites australis]
MAAGRVVAAAAVAAVALALLAGGADADCFDYCFKNCVANDKSMAEYCTYACDKTCAPDALLQRPLATVGGLPIQCQLACVRASCHRLRAGGKDMEACYGQCYDSCKTKALPRPLRAGAGPDKDSTVQPASVPDHPFNMEQGAVQPASVPDHPFNMEQDAVQPASTASVPDHPFRKKQGSVRPASEPDKDDAVQPASEPDPDRATRPVGPVRPDPPPFLEKQDAVQPASEPDRDDAVRRARGRVLP